ncbi:MAG: hypothetical protein KH208_14890 [Desulfovibrio sp.]|uniref:HGGxSTG domain-containing protein n=1 Tax=Desulfovibrio sp. TaxID=885 RepID=UPI0025B7A923|nr:HGGxSTG domain-containing protein [Desulfovibrio sp.]MBS6831116.1 hypothetical protein [Desulfovibrio sp.]
MPAPSYQNWPRCSATSHSTGEQCKNTCVPGKRVCRFHGGLSSGPPKGSKNALRTGAHETILAATMTPEEQAYLAGLDTDPLTMLRENLKMLKLRELRIMQRIQRAREAEALAGQPTGEQDSEGNQRRHPSGFGTFVGLVLAAPHGQSIRRLWPGSAVVRGNGRLAARDGQPTGTVACGYAAGDGCGVPGRTAEKEGRRRGKNITIWKRPEQTPWPFSLEHFNF